MATGWGAAFLQFCRLQTVRALWGATPEAVRAWIKNSLMGGIPLAVFARAKGYWEQDPWIAALCVVAGIFSVWGLGVVIRDVIRSRNTELKSLRVTIDDYGKQRAWGWHPVDDYLGEHETGVLWRIHLYLANESEKPMTIRSWARFVNDDDYYWRKPLARDLSATELRESATLSRSILDTPPDIFNRLSNPADVGPGQVVSGCIFFELELPKFTSGWNATTHEVVNQLPTVSVDTLSFEDLVSGREVEIPIGRSRQ